MKKVIGTIINGLLFGGMTMVSNVEPGSSGYWTVLGLCFAITVNSALTLRND